jgi:hypothetical protein
MIPHFLDNRSTDGGEVISLTRRLRFTRRKSYGIHFCSRLSQSHGHSAAGKITSIEKSNNLIWNQPITLPCTPPPLVRVPVNTLLNLRIPIKEVD